MIADVPLHCYSGVIKPFRVSADYALPQRMVRTSCSATAITASRAQVQFSQLQLQALPDIDRTGLEGNTEQR